MSQSSLESYDTDAADEDFRSTRVVRIRQEREQRRQEREQRRQEEQAFQEMMDLGLMNEPLVDFPVGEADGYLPTEGLELPRDAAETEDMELALDDLHDMAQRIIQEYLAETASTSMFGSKRKLKKKTNTKKGKNVRNSNSKRR